MAINTGVLYGASKTYKSWNLGLLSKHIFSKTNKPIRWVTADGGGVGPVMKFIQAGIIEPLSIGDDPQRLALMRKIVEGWWPATIIDGRREGKQMLPPTSLKDVGGYVFEGVTSISEAIHRLYVGRKTGMNPPFSENVTSDLTDESNKSLTSGAIGGFSQDSYGIVQNEVMRLLNYSWTLPTSYVWWSGHEASAEDDLTRKIVRGIALVGNAATPRIGKNVGEMIHTYRTEIGEVTLPNGRKEKKMEIRYYFQSHADNLLQNVFWEASPRIAGDDIPLLLKNFEGGFFVPSYEMGLDAYIATEEELLQEGTDSMKAWKDSILSGGIK